MMSFTHVPKESKKNINKAGDVLRGESSSPKDVKKALDLADQWRACHAYPINTFRATLTKTVRSGDYVDDYIIAQRLKRMPTILDKLNRYPKMKLTRMQDIGGVRVVLDSINEVYKLSEEYKSKKAFKHELRPIADYIANPRSEDGYRSLHLIYKYNNNQSKGKEYNGLLLELQIRTKLQHLWATAVETMGTFLAQALKSRQGDQDWLDFFAVVSSAFAHIESTALVPRFANMTKNETFLKVREMESSLKALQQMQGYAVALKEIVKRSKFHRQSFHYHLIILNHSKSTLQIKPYNRDEFKKAATDYAKVEASVGEEQIESVLVSAGPLNKLRQAYPNFFLDISEFSTELRKIISTVS